MSRFAAGLCSFPPSKEASRAAAHAGLVLSASVLILVVPIVVLVVPIVVLVLVLVLGRTV